MLAQELPRSAKGSFDQGVPRRGPMTPTRTAWCYGDPGVAAALLVAARCAGEAPWERHAIRIALRAAARAEGIRGWSTQGSATEPPVSRISFIACIAPPASRASRMLPGPGSRAPSRCGASRGSGASARTSRERRGRAVLAVEPGVPRGSQWRRAGACGGDRLPAGPRVGSRAPPVGPRLRGALAFASPSTQRAGGADDDALRFRTSICCFTICPILRARPAISPRGR